MKKLLASLLALTLLASILCINAFAASDVEFSMNGAQGKPGDVVEVQVLIDKNIGTWSAKFVVEFNQRYFTLLDVENGDVFPDSGFLKGDLTKSSYIYFAYGEDPTKNIEATGVVLTLKFEISKAAPNGEHEIKLSFPQNGAGWFFDATDESFPDRSVDCKNSAIITVSGSDATADPNETTAAPESSAGNNGDKNSPEETKAPAKPNNTPSNKPVTEAVTDEAGSTVVDESGNVVTEIVKDENGNDLYYETDENGEIETDDKGESITVAVDNQTAATPEDNTTDSDEDKSDDADAGEEDNGMIKKIILIAAIAAVVIGAVIVIIVLAKNNKKPENEE